MMLKLLQDSLNWKQQTCMWPLLPSMVIAARQRTRNTYVHSSLISTSGQVRQLSEEDTIVKGMLSFHYTLSSQELGYLPPLSSIPVQVYMPIGYLIGTSQSMSGSLTLRSSKRSALETSCTSTLWLLLTLRELCAVLIRSTIRQLHRNFTVVNAQKACVVFIDEVTDQR